MALMLMVSAVVALPLALDHLGLAQESKIIVSLGRWPVMFVILLAALGLLYRFGPSRRAARWEWLSVGTLAASLLWIAGSSLLSWYLSNFGNYDATYGSLGAAIGLMMWMWMSAVIVLCGAELNSEIEHQTARDSTVGGPSRSAPAAPSWRTQWDRRFRNRRITLVFRINIDAKLGAPGGAQDASDTCGFRVLPGGGSLDLRALHAQ